jgi:hypothetical protein
MVYIVDVVERADAVLRLHLDGSDAPNTTSKSAATAADRYRRSF